MLASTCVAKARGALGARSSMRPAGHGRALGAVGVSALLMDRGEGRAAPSTGRDSRGCGAAVILRHFDVGLRALDIRPLMPCPPSGRSASAVALGLRQVGTSIRQDWQRPSPRASRGGQNCRTLDSEIPRPAYAFSRHALGRSVGQRVQHRGTRDSEDGGCRGPDHPLQSRHGYQTRGASIRSIMLWARRDRIQSALAASSAPQALRPR